MDSVTSVDGDGTVVTLPCNSELEDSLGDLNHVEGSSVLGVLGEELYQKYQHLQYRLMVNVEQE